MEKNMIKNTRIIRTKTLDPWWNLAVEEYLLETVAPDECILYLWQNQNTVVIGKHQNPWRECRTDVLEKEGGKLARRLSGGGAVFHDLGNLNFTFIMGKENYNLERQVKVILLAVKSLGIDAEMTGRNDLTVDDRKFSGNAFCFRKDSAYHHGTVLVSADFSKLSGYLQVSEEKIKSKGIESVKSRVVNLCEYRPSLTINEMADALITAFREIYGGNPTVEYNSENMNQDILKELYDKYSSWEWRYGKAPDFDMEISTRFPWGGVDIGLKFENGMVSEAKVFSDAMDEEYIGTLPELLKGCAFKSEALVERIRNSDISDERKGMAEDIAAWLEGKGF